VASDPITFPVLERARTRPNSLYRSLRFFLDPVLAGCALLALAPVLAVLAAVVKCGDRGKILFRQTRIGKNGRPFVMWKFRTMRPNANAYSRKPTAAGAGLITRTGRFLRERCLDELPQLISVLKGDMQLIGPRPEMPFIVESYSARDRERLRVKPGITGLWQVCAPKDEPIHVNIDFDLHYIQAQCFALDLWIVKETLKILIGMRDRDEAPRSTHS